MDGEGDVKDLTIELENLNAVPLYLGELSIMHEVHVTQAGGESLQGLLPISTVLSVRLGLSKNLRGYFSC